jgi:hypothetical protein
MPGWLQGLSWFITGFGIGWISGLSVSPVAPTLVASVIGMAAGALVAYRAVTKPDGDKPAMRVPFDAVPLGLVVLGLSCGVPTGIGVRTHDLLGFAPAPVEDQKDTKAKSKTPITSGGATWRNTVLFGVRMAEDCDELLGWAAQGNEVAFRGELKQSVLQGAKVLATRIDSFETLKIVVEAQCTEP